MTSVGTVYAQALYSLAKDEDCCKVILDQLTVLQESFAAEPDFLRLLAAPNLSKEERCAVVDSSFRDKVHPYLLNFMKILCENGTIRQFGDCAQEFKRRYNEDNGILEVQAVTAVAMNEALTAKLRDRLSEVTGKRIELSCKVDPTCLGGVRLEMDGMQMDGTIQQRLDTMRRQLAETVL